MIDINFCRLTRCVYEDDSLHRHVHVRDMKELPDPDLSEQKSSAYRSRQASGPQASRPSYPDSYRRNLVQGDEEHSNEYDEVQRMGGRGHAREAGEEAGRALRLVRERDDDELRKR